MHGWSLQLVGYVSRTVLRLSLCLKMFSMDDKVDAVRPRSRLKMLDRDCEKTIILDNQTKSMLWTIVNGGN